MLRDILVYLWQAGAWFGRYPRTASWTWVPDFFRWQKARRHGLSSLDFEQPWMCLPAVRALGRLVDAQTRAFEYGCGGSTLFLAQRCRQVISVEHDPYWSEEIRQRVKKRGLCNSVIELVLPQNIDGRDELDTVYGYGSSDLRFAGHSFRAYVHAIEAYPRQYFDLILVDGRARPACIRLACQWLAPGGALVLDNAEDPTYAAVQRERPLTKWRRLRCAGPVYGTVAFSATQFWFRPLNAADISPRCTWHMMAPRRAAGLRGN